MPGAFSRAFAGRSRVKTKKARHGRPAFVFGACALFSLFSCVLPLAKTINILAAFHVYTHNYESNKLALHRVHPGEQREGVQVQGVTCVRVCFCARARVRLSVCTHTRVCFCVRTRVRVPLYLHVCVRVAGSFSNHPMLLYAQVCRKPRPKRAETRRIDRFSWRCTKCTVIS